MREVFPLSFPLRTTRYSVPVYIPPLLSRITPLPREPRPLSFSVYLSYSSNGEAPVKRSVWSIFPFSVFFIVSALCERIVPFLLRNCGLFLL